MASKRRNVSDNNNRFCGAAKRKAIATGEEACMPGAWPVGGGGGIDVTVAMDTGSTRAVARAQAAFAHGLSHPAHRTAPYLSSDGQHGRGCRLPPPPEESFRLSRPAHTPGRRAPVPGPLVQNLSVKSSRLLIITLRPCPSVEITRRVETTVASWSSRVK
ncbi:hypothetical protein AAG570_010131 [Ranatra chinensis]|uniref:Uncharacterized protein n=1 Tax=Ranatra chinensis TaxID=642074 RepID=A0ABD0YLT1_9HEMI